MNSLGLGVLGGADGGSCLAIFKNSFNKGARLAQSVEHETLKNSFNNKIGPYFLSLLEQI